MVAVITRKSIRYPLIVLVEGGCVQWTRLAQTARVGATARALSCKDIFRADWRALATVNLIPTTGTIWVELLVPWWRQSAVRMVRT